MSKGEGRKTFDLHVGLVFVSSCMVYFIEQYQISNSFQTSIILVIEEAIELS